MSPVASVVEGYCPMGCGQTLRVYQGRVRCSGTNCPDRLAVTTILSNPETEHVVQVLEDRFTIQHPLRERVEGDLFVCKVHLLMQGMDGPPDEPGMYRVTLKQHDPTSESFRSGDVGLDFERLDG